MALTGDVSACSDGRDSSVVALTRSEPPMAGGACRRRSGIAAGSCHIKRLMREHAHPPADAASSPRPTATTTSPSDRSRDSEVDGPNRLWVADLTYIAILGGFVYMAAIMDAWSRRIVGHAIGRRIDARLTLAALARRSLAASSPIRRPDLPDRSARRSARWDDAATPMTPWWKAKPEGVFPDRSRPWTASEVGADGTRANTPRVGRLVSSIAGKINGGLNEWVADLTYIAILGGFVYMAAIMDAWSRRIVGHAIGRRIDARLTLAALKLATVMHPTNRDPRQGDRTTVRRSLRQQAPQPAGGLHPPLGSGSQYAAQTYRTLLRDHGLVGSMGRRGNPYDAPMGRLVQQPAAVSDWIKPASETARSRRWKAS